MHLCFKIIAIKIHKRWEVLSVLQCIDRGFFWNNTNLPCLLLLSFIWCWFCYFFFFTAYQHWTYLTPVMISSMFPYLRALDRLHQRLQEGFWETVWTLSLPYWGGVSGPIQVHQRGNEESLSLSGCLLNYPNYTANEVRWPIIIVHIFLFFVVVSIYYRNIAKHCSCANWPIYNQLLCFLYMYVFFFMQ